MKIIYSCVVDGDPKFLKQAQLLVLSLLEVGVPGSRIIVNLTPAALQYKDSFDELGVHTASVPFFADGRYCNKVVQLRNVPAGLDFVICCDTDIVFFENIESHLESKKGKFLGKVVDYANPPIELFREVLDLLEEDCSIPEVQTDLDMKPTFRGNFNGGLYVIPGARVPSIGALWER